MRRALSARKLARQPSACQSTPYHRYRRTPSHHPTLNQSPTSTPLHAVSLAGLTALSVEFRCLQLLGTYLDIQMLPWPSTDSPDHGVFRRFS